MVNYVGPHGGALIYKLEPAAAAGAAFGSQLEDDFFEHSLEDLKVGAGGFRTNVH